MNREAETKVWTQALYLSWGALVDAQWNPCLHCFPVLQQNSFWKGKTTACYTMWSLQSWSKEESQITGRKLNIITPIFIFVLRSQVASLCKGCDNSHVKPSSRDWALLADTRRKDTLLVLPIYLCFFAQGSTGVSACNTSIWLACHLAVIMDNIMSNFWLSNANKDPLSIKKKALVLYPYEDSILIKNIHDTD